MLVAGDSCPCCAVELAGGRLPLRCEPEQLGRFLRAIFTRRDGRFTLRRNL